MEPIFDPQFLECNYGYRKGRSPHDAMRQVWRELQAGKVWLVDADLRQFFDTIDQCRLVDLIAEEISDGRVLRLIQSILSAGVIEAGTWKPTLTGVPQGSPASPLWSNIFLTPFDRTMTEAGFSLIRWADDFVVLCHSQAEAEQALRVAAGFLQDTLGVCLHPEKTRIVHVRHGFEFLGYKIKGGKGFQLPSSKRRRTSNPQNLYAIPREKSVNRFKDQIRCLTRRSTPLKLPELIKKINPVIRGWGNYYRKAHVRRLFNRLDRWITQRLYSFMSKRWRNRM